MPIENSNTLFRAIQILDCFSQEHPELGVREVARMVNLSSSATGRILAEKTLFLGEVGLTGEVRPVAQLPLRLNEGARLGFAAAAVPRLGLEGKQALPCHLETSVERLRSKTWLKERAEEEG